MKTLSRTEQVQKANRIIIKIGSSLLTNSGQGLCAKRIYAWAADIAKLFEQDKQIVLVSSGSIAAGISLMQLDSKPTEIKKLQALAAIGQMQLIETWRRAFAVQELNSAQVLLTHADFAHRDRYLNAKNALEQLLDYGTIAIINENDTVATDEIKLGDNDTLAAKVANILDADLLILLTDQTGIFTADPKQNPDAELIQYANAEDDYLLSIAGDPGKLGTGGMRTKVLAARIAAKSATDTIIADGNLEDIIDKLTLGENIGSFLYSDEPKINARKRWILAQNAKGEIVLDSGATLALTKNNKSLLPVGIKYINGDFERGDCVYIYSMQKQKLALGISNYSSEVLREILGKTSAQITELLGDLHDKEAVHKDNLVLL